MLKIRLRRTGARKRPSYRVVVAESTAPRDGHYIEIIGFYDPLTDPATVRIDGEKAQTWLGKGATPTDRVARLLTREGIIERPAPAVAAESAPPPAPTRRRRAAATAQSQAVATAEPEAAPTAEPEAAPTAESEAE